MLLAKFIAGILGKGIERTKNRTLDIAISNSPAVLKAKVAIKNAHEEAIHQIIEFYGTDVPEHVLTQYGIEKSEFDRIAKTI